MKVTPLDIRRKEFKRSMRGYSDEDVDIFLDEVADEFERLFQENIELNDRVQRLEEQVAGHAQMREALEKTLISAQMQADEIKVNARKEGELILKDAELKARNVVSDSYEETRRVQQALTQLKLLEEDFRYKFRSLLEGHLKLLKEVPITVSEAGALAEEGPPAAETETPPAVSALELEEAPGAQAGPAGTEPGGAPAAGEGASPGSTAVPESVGAATEVASGVSAKFALAEDDTPTEETVTVSGEPGAEQAGSAELEAAELEAEELEAAELVAELAGLPETAPGKGTGEGTKDGLEEPAALEEADEEESEAGGFFFGRRLDDDDTFPPPDTGEISKGRDFEW